MSKDTVLSYYREKNLLDDAEFISTEVDEELVDMIATTVQDIPTLLPVSNTYERRKIHLICEALGLFSKRQPWMDMTSHVCEGDCSGCAAACTRVGISYSRLPMELDTKKARSSEKKRVKEREEQWKKYTLQSSTIPLTSADLEDGHKGLSIHGV
jgi:hypothetical protein